MQHSESLNLIESKWNKNVEMVEWQVDNIQNKECVHGGLELAASGEYQEAKMFGGLKI